ncbi:CDP-glycerol glycerophosphotransferase family protein [Mesobacillus maritimus]|uniref:CDP-glycerol glycerophosphotransferase family protein n=1 Tax=Mesobacillus maritimus TaxID=1643336 RepID=UPI00203AC3E0|nr:CDP-glycerol glycerophosphotransferase family protein [Mesobacillus maritimus]
MNINVIKKGLNFAVKPAFQYLLRERYRVVNQYVRYYEKLKIEDKVILYESRDGKSITDSPYAMFKYLLDHPKYKDFKHIWSVADFNELSRVISAYKEYPNVQFVRRNSKEYLRYLASSQYLINNSTFQPFYLPKKNQIYINTWHGTPLKKMGFEIPGNPAHSQNVIRNFLCTDYLISPNEHTTKMFTDSYKLDGLYEGTIIEEGYPRIDLTLKTDPQRFKGKLRDLGLEFKDQTKTLLYAPTWKGKNVSNAKNDMLQIIGDLRYLEEQVGDEYSFLVKVHPFLYKAAVNYEELKSKLVPDYIDTNELLSTVDLLVTDYSSIFFDFLVTGKPIIFYTWDADVYMDERGQYFSNDVLPGPIVYNSLELAETIKQMEDIKPKFQERYQDMQQQFTRYEDGNVTERVVQAIFNGNTEKVHTISSLATEKQKILIYPGGMRDNGITTSFINLMNNIDFDQYDVTCFTKTPKNKEIIKNINKVNKKVRFLFNPGIPIYDLFEVYRDKYVHYRGAGGRLGKRLYPEKSYMREHVRLFGKSKFDYVIDFSGYSLYWAKLLLAADAKKKICYLHNDLLSDSKKIINGKKPHRINLRGLFSVYNRFDKLVSVSKGTMELNRKNLSKYADFDKFDYVMNSINPDRILQSNKPNQNQNESVENQENAVLTEPFFAKAVLKDIKDYPVYSFVPGHQSAQQHRLEEDFDNVEVLLFRKMDTEDTTYYKFSYFHQIIGWIDERALEILPDEVLTEKKVKKLARLVKPGGNTIWSKPYNVPGCTIISNSADYKGITFEIDQEAETLHGRYYRISLKGTTIGWVNQAALAFHRCTVHDEMGRLTKWKKTMKGRVIKTLNHRKNKTFIAHLENRILEEQNFEQPMFAEIAEPVEHSIWTKPYKTFNAKLVSDAKDFKGKVAKILKKVKTKEGTYYQFSIDNKVIGWLDSQVFKIKRGLPDYMQYQTEFGEELTGGFLPKADDNQIRFVNMGRLSPEKGQDNLIIAFTNVHKTYPNSQLYILGKGPLKDPLQNLIEELGMTDSIHLMGQLENPFVFMEKCDCFVLSSHYEGQPMVLLEAMTLGMKIIATDIVANRTVLENGKYGMLVENSISGLEKGMTSIITKDMPDQDRFDYRDYNHLAMETFYQALEHEQYESHG